MPSDHIAIVLANPENYGILAALEQEGIQRKGPRTALESLESYPKPYMSSLYTHPDILDRMWSQLGKGLPADTRGVCWGYPVLVSPSSGLIFCVGVGTFYLLRLDRDEIAMDSKIEMRRQFVAKVGEGWKIGEFRREEVDVCRKLCGISDHHES